MKLRAACLTLPHGLRRILTQYRDALPGKSGHSNGRYDHSGGRDHQRDGDTGENLTVWKSFLPVALELDGVLLKSADPSCCGRRE